ncbi:hypothetical protein MSI_06260 [Treponema sp. JC4]|uniref:hypothetical protein n=1 Tax=Treponema sp. JC4 TaxID=1124982 RepID=UPI00025AFB7A|nr:hypothetical protein [Treponema sp. JC4]EID85807.1 hypothetical protein MSI_06260 [Treponema sp. JC4]
MQNKFHINYEEIDSYIKTEFHYKIHDTPLEIKSPTPNYSSINDFIQQSDDILQDNIRKMILAKQLDEVEVYKKADIDRKLFSKIRTQPDYHPNKNTLLKLCLAMNLNTDETENLLKSAGYSLSRSLRSDLILRYCFGHRIFDVITVNQILDHYGEKII